MVSSTIAPMSNSSVFETITAVMYRLAAYGVNTFVDDPAMWAFIFC